MTYLSQRGSNKRFWGFLARLLRSQFDIIPQMLHHVLHLAQVIEDCDIDNIAIGQRCIVEDSDEPLNLGDAFHRTV